MDNFVIHLAPLSRRFPHPAPVHSIGHIAAKRDWVDHAFSSMNFSFIVEGRGSYCMDDRWWDVVAPCVITQWPGRHVRYGPKTTWREIYLIYDRSHQQTLEHCGYARRDLPVWRVAEAQPVVQMVEELLQYRYYVGRPGRADEIDRLCDRLVLASRLGAEAPPLTPIEESIRAIEIYLRAHFTEALDYDELALDHGLSPSSFRRHWGRIVGEPPARFVTRLRIRLARRLLVETSLPLGEISWRVGYPDPLYFSRRFRAEAGTTASEYRRVHRSPLARGDLEPA